MNRSMAFLAAVTVGVSLDACTDKAAPPVTAAQTAVDAAGSPTADAGSAQADAGTDASVLPDLPDVPAADVPDAAQAADVAPTSEDVVASADVASSSDLTSSADVTIEDAAATAPDASSAPDATADAPWFPQWLDDNGCESYEHFENGKCESDNLAQKTLEKKCWETGQVNDFGVGKPCKPGEVECTGLKAGCCDVDNKDYGAICTMPCNAPGGCGPNTWCLKYKNICVPAACQPLFEEFYASHMYTGSGFACSQGSVGSAGVGKACSKGGNECQGQKASDCLGDPTFLGEPGSTSFCTMACEANADCPSGSSCIHSNGPPYFCAPDSCKTFFAGILFQNKANYNELKDKCGYP